MNSLSQHIEYLLLTHNCVIVPQFGAFVTHSSNAQRAESEELFFPPRRVVRFNPALTEDDGLLVDVVRAVHQCSIPDAKRLIQAMVLQLRQQLLADGQTDFGTIGIFTQDEDGKMTFSACQAGITTPDYYGLDAFAMSKLTTLQRRDKLADKHKATSEGFSDNDKPIVIRISRRTLRYVSTVAAVVLLCVLFTPPIHNYRQRIAQEASMLPPVESVKETPAQKSVFTPKEAIKAATVQAPAVENTAKAEAKVFKAEAAKAQYAIVVASDVSLKNAERYVADLKLRGYENAEIFDNGKMLRVVLGGYADETEAYNRNASLHHEGKEFASSWVMKL